MKQKFLLSVVLISAMLFSSCAEAKQPLYAPSPSPLPVSGDINWNDISDEWRGTGGSEASDIASWGVYEALNYERLPYEMTYYDWEEKGIFKTRSVAHFSGLENKRLQNEINTKVSEITDSFFKDESFFKGVDIHNPDGELYLSQSAYTDVCMTGNILSVNISMYQYIFDGNNEKYKNDYYAMNYDILTGKQLRLSDLFTDGCDVGALLNPIISAKLSSSNQLKRPFRGLPKDYPNFSLQGDGLVLFMPSSNPYGAADTIIIPFQDLLHCLAQPTAEITETIKDANIYMIYRSGDSWKRVTDKDMPYIDVFGDENYRIDTDYVKSAKNPEAADKINADLKDIYSVIASLPMPEKWENAIKDGSENAFGYAYSDLTVNQSFIMFHFMACMDFAESYSANEIMRFSRCYDAETGEIIKLKDLIKDEKGFDAYLRDNGIEISDDFSNFGTYRPDEIYFYEGGLGTVYGVNEEYTVPYELINTDYFKTHK